MKPCVHAWWRRQGPAFRFPPCYNGHAHRWHKIDIDTVGCELCGSQI